MTGRPATACSVRSGMSTRVGGWRAAMGERRDLDPTGGRSAPARRPYTVHVSEAIEYQGWVLATGVDDAAEVCWNCGTDPRHPNSGCPHPPPGQGQPLAAGHATIDPIRRVLVLSTAHLPEHLGRHRLCDEYGVVASDLDGYGWLMWVPPDPDSHAADYSGPPAEVLTIQRYARQRGCDYVLLGQDADIIDGLPTWDW